MEQHYRDVQGISSRNLLKLPLNPKRPHDYDFILEHFIKVKINWTSLLSSPLLWLVSWCDFKIGLIMDFLTKKGFFRYPYIKNKKCTYSINWTNFLLLCHGWTIHYRDLWLHPTCCHLLRPQQAPSWETWLGGIFFSQICEHASFGFQFYKWKHWLHFTFYMLLFSFGSFFFRRKHPPMIFLHFSFES